MNTGYSFRYVFVLTGCIAAFAGLVLGCGANQRLVNRLEMLEKKMGDIQRSQGKMIERIDEIEIQISLLAKKFEYRQNSTHEKNLSLGGELVTEDPDVVHSAKVHAQRKPAPKIRSYEKLMAELDPRIVSERLPPDPATQTTKQNMRPVHDRASRDLARAQQAYTHSDHKQVVAILVEWLQQYAEHPDVAKARYILGNSRIVLGDLDKAQGDFTIIAEKYPKDRNAPQALFMAGRCQERLGRLRQARSTYLQLVESYPLTKEAADANQRLKALR